MGLKVCQQKYISLVNFEPVVKTTKVEEPNTETTPIQDHESESHVAKQFYLNLLK
jgi:hypothetical protein